MHKKFGIARSLILKLWRDSDKAWRARKLSAPWSYTYDLLRYRMNQMAEKELERLMPKNGPPKCDFGKWHTFFYLPPLERASGFVALLFFTCDLVKPDPFIRFQVAFYRWPKEEEKVQCYGFRFEGPHADKGGRHQFYHAQLTTSLRKVPKSVELEELPQWVRKHIPTFPLPADCPVCLFLCVLASLYGKGGFERDIDWGGIDKKCTERLGCLLDQKT